MTQIDEISEGIKELLDKYEKRGKEIDRLRNSLTAIQDIARAEMDRKEKLFHIGSLAGNALK